MAHEASKDKKAGIGEPKKQPLNEKLKVESDKADDFSAAKTTKIPGPGITTDFPLNRKESAATPLMNAVLCAELNYNAKKAGLPHYKKIEEQLLETAGIVSNEQYAFVMIDIGSPDTGKFTSACGTAALPVFSNVDVIRFLRENGVNGIIGVVYDHEAQDTYDGKRVPLSAIVLPINEERGRKFEEIVSRIGGSFRCEKLNLETINKDDLSCKWHWTIYESE
jgi:hypothetical protein